MAVVRPHGAELRLAVVEDLAEAASGVGDRDGRAVLRNVDAQGRDATMVTRDIPSVIRLRPGGGRRVRFPKPRAHVLVDEKGMVSAFVIAAGASPYARLEAREGGSCGAVGLQGASR